VDVACANGSGFSAAKYNLPTPAYTVMAAVLASGIESGKQTLRALSGLETDTLYFVPRPARRRSFLKEVLHPIDSFRLTPLHLRWRLKSVSYRYNHFVTRPHEDYLSLVNNLCDHDPELMEQLRRKQPSTGFMTLAIGLSSDQYNRYIISGFSFQLTHAYAHNPEIDQRGTSLSGHANTDITLIRYLSEKYRNIFTTERIVSERTSIPMLR
jgi:hypothetical protein